MSSQKSASDADPEAAMVEVWNASPRGNTLIAILTTVAVTRRILRLMSGPRSQLTALVRGTCTTTHVLVCCGIPFFSISFGLVLSCA